MLTLLLPFASPLFFFLLRELANNNIPPNSVEKELDGTSLMKILQDKTNEDFKKRAIFTEINKDRAVTTEKYKYYWKQIEDMGSGKKCGKGGDPGTIAKFDHVDNYDDLVQLYNLETDSLEQNNLAGSGLPEEAELKLLLECHLAKTSIQGGKVFGKQCDGVDSLVDVGGMTSSPSASPDVDADSSASSLSVTRIGVGITALASAFLFVQ